MAAEIGFYVGDSFSHKLSGSGLGFYGSSFGSSVAVGAYQDTTYVTNSTGVTQGIQIDNVKWVHESSGQVAGGVTLALQSIPNAESTVNVRFTNDTSVLVQNWLVKIYDRITSTAAPSGLTAKLASIIHPNPVQGATGSGSTSWLHQSGVGIAQTLSLPQSPGISGIYAGNGSTSTRVDTRHDAFVSLSASPDSIGSKSMFGLYCSCEYL